MRILKHRPGRYKVSVILLDWGVRESFHAIDYLNQQSADRDSYEIIWIELYHHVPPALRAKVDAMEAAGKAGIDQWIVFDADPSVYFHKHFAYNVGIALAGGEICVICDSDVIFPPDFIARIAQSFDEDPRRVVHIDEVRNFNQGYYPFSHPPVEEVLADRQTANWNGTTTTGLVDGADILHDANYGACMAARRDDLIAIGGADEHRDYLGYICGPYELTFRLVNHGRSELWLKDVVLVHTWHPGEGGDGNFAGPDDGRGIAHLAVEAQRSGRVAPMLINPTIAALQAQPDLPRAQVIASLEAVDTTAWRNEGMTKILRPSLVVEDVNGQNVIRFDARYYACPQSMGAFYAEKALAGEYAGLPQDNDLERLLAFLRQPPRPVAPPAAPTPSVWARARGALASGWRAVTAGR